LIFVGHTLTVRRSIALRARLGLAGRTRAQHTLGASSADQNWLGRCWNENGSMTLAPGRSLPGPTVAAFCTTDSPSRSGLVRRQIWPPHPPCRPYHHLVISKNCPKYQPVSPGDPPRRHKNGITIGPRCPAGPSSSARMAGGAAPEPRMWKLPVYMNDDMHSMGPWALARR